jgi:hypothetical protein
MTIHSLHNNTVILQHNTLHITIEFITACVVAVATTVALIGSFHVQNCISEVASDRRRRSLEYINGRVSKSFDIGSYYEYNN